MDFRYGERAREALGRPPRNPLFAQPGDSESEQVTKAALRFGVQETSRLILTYFESKMFHVVQIEYIRVWFSLLDLGYRVHVGMTAGKDVFAAIPERTVLDNSTSKAKWSRYISDFTTALLKEVVGSFTPPPPSPSSHISTSTILPSAWTTTTTSTLSWSTVAVGTRMFVTSYEQNGELGAIATRLDPDAEPVSEEEEAAAIESIKRSWK